MRERERGGYLVANILSIYLSIYLSPFMSTSLNIDKFLCILHYRWTLQ